MNKAILIGNLTRDPELTQTSNGISICKFSIAVNRTFSNANGERETDFFNIVAWRALAETCSKYLRKGLKVCVCGNIQTRTYEVDGVKKYATDIVADEVEFLTPRDYQGSGGSFEPRESSGTERVAAPAPKKTVKDSTPIEDEELPF